MPRPVHNPPNPWLETEIDWEGEPPQTKLEVYEERAISALVENESPDIGYRWGINPYRGCYHGCIYCYARPTHEYLGWGAGTDFDRRIVVKTNLPALLRKEMGKPKWAGELIGFSGVTDCYQPLEASYRITRGCLEVCRDFANPVGIITKSAIIERDLDVLTDLARHAKLGVILSIPFADDDTGRRFEPYASPISKRLRTLARLSAAGIRTGVALAPIIPGVNDASIPDVLLRARDAGARSSFMTLLRLPSTVRPYFEARVDELVPLRAKKIKNTLHAMRQGKVNDTFGKRLVGEGPQWNIVADLFSKQRQRLGLDEPLMEPGPTTFRRPGEQLGLF
ncbi:MAG: radical SAM protein [Myxococcales bacterium]|nr:radical SAM protein [Myxococcales bacterium]